MNTDQRITYNAIEQTPLCSQGDDFLLQRVCERTEWTLPHHLQLPIKRRKKITQTTTHPKTQITGPT